MNDLLDYWQGERQQQNIERLAQSTELQGQNIERIALQNVRAEH